MQIDSGLHHTIMGKAAYQVYLKFHLNKSELYTLLQLDYYLRTQNKTFCGLDAFVGFVSGNNRVKIYIHGYLKGLLTKSFIGQFEYVSAPGSRSIGISDTGIMALREYDKNLPIIGAKYPISPYRIELEHSPSFTEDRQPERYFSQSA